MTTARRFQQEIIKLTFNGKTYQIRAETVKVTKKQDSEQWTASEKVNPYAIAYGGKSYEIQLSGVDPNQKYIFNSIFTKQTKGELKKLPTLKTFGYDEHGKTKADDAFAGVWIEEYSKENATPFDVKLGALEEITNKKKKDKSDDKDVKSKNSKK